GSARRSASGPPPAPAAVRSDAGPGRETPDAGACGATRSADRTAHQAAATGVASRENYARPCRAMTGRRGFFRTSSEFFPRPPWGAYHLVEGNNPFVASLCHPVKERKDERSVVRGVVADRPDRGHVGGGVLRRHGISARCLAMVPRLSAAAGGRRLHQE